MPSMPSTQGGGTCTATSGISGTAGTSSADPLSNESLEIMLASLKAEDQGIEKELSEYYKEGLSLLGMRDGNIDQFSLNMMEIMTRSGRDEGDDGNELNEFMAKDGGGGMSGMGPSSSHHGTIRSLRTADARRRGAFNPRSRTGYTPSTSSIRIPTADSALNNTSSSGGGGNGGGQTLVLDEALLKNLVDTVKHTEDTAEELCSRVRKLDRTSSRIQECLKFVNELLAVRDAAETIHESITNKDYEKAARTIARYRQALVEIEACEKGGTANFIDETALRNIEEGCSKLSNIVTTEFERAIKSKDQKGVSRFAKLFFPLGLADSAVHTYIQFMQERIRESAREKMKKCKRTAVNYGLKGGEMPPYAGALWAIFEGIGDILQQNKANVEVEFGLENYILFLHGICQEVSSQQTKMLSLFQEQEYGKLLADLEKKGGGGDHNRQQQQQQSTPTTFPKERVRQILATMQQLSQVAETFDSYIRNLIIEAYYDKSEEELEEILQRIISEADATKAAQDMISHYVLLQKELILIELETAITGDVVDIEDPDPAPSSLVDEVFFVVKTGIENSLQTCSILAVCSLVNHVAHFLCKEGGIVYERLYSDLVTALPAYRAFVQNPRNLQIQGSTNEPLHGLHKLYLDLLEQGGAKKKNVQARDSWPHAANNAYKCSEYIDRLIASIREDFQTKVDMNGVRLFPDDIPAEKKMIFDQCLTSLSNVKADFKALCTEVSYIQGANPVPGVGRTAVFVLKNQVVQALSGFESANLNIDESQFQDWQVNDLFVNAFLQEVRLLHAHVCAVFIPEAVDFILDVLVVQTCTRMEVKIREKQEVSLWGGLQIDQDIRSLMTFFISLCESVPVRNRFKKLSQIASLLALENVKELKDFYSQQKWELSPDDIQKFLLLRFSEADIQTEATFLTKPI